MTGDRLIQIVPYRARAPEGVGDHARLLAEEFRASMGIETSFVACTPLPPEARCNDEWETVQLPRRGTKELLDALATLERRDGPAPILLHLSGFGFHRRGAPFWLATALDRWQRSHSEGKLAVVFHELFATGPVNSRNFWFGQLQRFPVRHIARIADGGITALDRKLAWLRHAVDVPANFHPMPCFSTIGETVSTLPTARERPARLAIFGRSNVLPGIYRQRGDLLAAFVRANAIEQIVDIGPRAEDPPANVGGVPVTRLGALDPEPLRAELATARFGALLYDAGELPKSSIFAAYAAHGTIPLCFSASRPDSNGLRIGTHFLRLDHDVPTPVVDADAINQLQAHAMAWYRPHSIGRTAALLWALLGEAKVGDEAE